MRILVVEDNCRLLDLIAAHLNDAGFTVDTAQTAQEFREIFASFKHALCVIDLGLPDSDGICLIQEVRKSQNNTHILVATARAHIRDRISVLNGGADDYLVKPFHVDELLARVKALLRRSHPLEPPRRRVGSLVLDCETSEVSCRGRRLELRRSEQRLLSLLIRRSGHLVAKESIQCALEGIGTENSANALEKLISRLRRSLADCPAGIQLRTVKGLGYILEGNRKEDRI
jgi:two-component system OmpR family response regulator